MSRPPPANRANIAPWEEESPSRQGNGKTGGAPPSNRQSAWSPGDQFGQMPASIFGAPYQPHLNDNDDVVSPGFVSPNPNSYFGAADVRRPSAASAATASSSGSKSSGAVGKIHKKLQGFFGDDPNNAQEDGVQHSETSSLQSGTPALTPGGTTTSARNNNSVAGTGAPSPSESRPRTPPAGPSHEVTPWDFQDSQVRCAITRLP